MKVLDGRILRVDLSKQRLSYENFVNYKNYLGGRGVNQYILIKELPVGVSPFDASNVLAVGAGLLSGTKAPGSSRVSIDSKNPFTGGIGSSSVGGDFGPALRAAGINNIIITGKSKTLCYLSIFDECIEIREATHLRQKTVPEVEQALHEELGKDYQVMCIGPAGENLAKAACVIVNNARAGARCGMGAIFGSKNLKAIAVKGTKKIEAADPIKFREVVKRCVGAISRRSENREMMKTGIYGRALYKKLKLETPYRNFSGELFPRSKREHLKPENFLKYKVGKKPCDSCPINCGMVYRFKDSDGKSVTVNTLHMNSVCNFGVRLDIDDPRQVLKAHKLCNDLGLDEDASSNAIAWAVECYEKGIINSDDTEGKELKWGNAGTVFALIEDMAYRRGFGDVLADGCKNASERIGRKSGEYCLHIKGNDLYESIWVSLPWALGTVVSPRGGTHTRGAIGIRKKDMTGEMSMKLLGVPSIDPQSYDNQEKAVVFTERLTAILDCLGMCRSPICSLPPAGLFPEDYADLLSAATGAQMTPDELLLFGEKIHTLEKCFNVLHTDWTRKDDFPPRKFMEKPLAGKYALYKGKWSALLDRYYESHGWERGTGLPRKTTLINLGLGEIYRKLKRAGKLS